MRDQRKKQENRFSFPVNSDTSFAERYTISSAEAHILNHNSSVYLPMIKFFTVLFDILEVLTS